MSITFKEFSDILEKSVKSGAQKAKSKTGGQTGGKDTSIGMKSTTAKAPGGGGKSKEGKLGGGIKFGGSKGGKKPVVKKPEKKPEPEKKTEPEKPKQARFGGIGLVDRKKDTEQRKEQDRKRREGIAKKRKKDAEEKAKRIEADKKVSAQTATNTEKDKVVRKKKAEIKTKNIEKEKKKEVELTKQSDRLKTTEETMNTEASTKAEKLFIMHSAKQIGKVKNAEERERQITDLERKAKKMGFRRDWIERTLEKQGAYKDYGESYDIIKQEADKMHSYVNTLSLDRSVNLWAEAAKKDEDLDPVKGNKTLTKKSQEKITINPMEKQALRHG